MPFFYVADLNIFPKITRFLCASFSRQCLFAVSVGEFLSKSVPIRCFHRRFPASPSSDCSPHPSNSCKSVEAIVKWIFHIADLTLEIEILINLWAEALYFAVRGEEEEDDFWRGKSGSFHVTFFCAYSYARLLGTSVPWDFVSTHPRDEGVGLRNRFFIGMSVGSSVGTKEGVCFLNEGEDVVADNGGFDVGVISGSSE